jgi:hypothetical protein
MGYITEFGERLAELLYGVPDEQRRAILDFVKDELMKSYKNGLRDARNKPPQRNDKRPAHR